MGRKRRRKTEEENGKEKKKSESEEEKPAEEIEDKEESELDPKKVKTYLISVMVFALLFVGFSSCVGELDSASIRVSVFLGGVIGFFC